MDTTIREATSADLFWIRLLLGNLMAAMPEAYPSPTREDLEDQTAVLASRLGGGDPSLLCYVAEEGEAVVGFVLGDLLSRIGRPRNYLFVSFFYVAPGHRESGVGRALSTAIITQAKELGATALEFMSQAGDMQWTLRGWPAVAAVHSLPIDLAHATVVPVKSIPANGHGKGLDA